jgi:hypothetical protein
VTGIGLRREDDGTQRRCSDQTRSSTSASRSAIRRLVRLSRAHLSHSGSVSAVSKPDILYRARQSLSMSPALVRDGFW